MVLDAAKSWQPHLAGELEAPYMKALQLFLKQEQMNHKDIFPPEDHWFHALQATPLDKVKVVILGQDPYHQPGQAHGLSFSVKSGIKIPPSLLNIYKELESDLAIPRANHGCLESWAQQGVLLLNAVLTVEDSSAASHQKKGWEQFTDKVIEVVNQECEHVVFLLWGSYAQKKGAVINEERHLVLKAPHPSPLAAHRGFFGCHHFSQTNIYLKQQGLEPIHWQLEDEAITAPSHSQGELWS
jgi:uracil-DNA glycosylase